MPPVVVVVLRVYTEMGFCWLVSCLQCVKVRPVVMTGHWVRNSASSEQVRAAVL